MIFIIILIHHNQRRNESLRWHKTISVKGFHPPPVNVQQWNIPSTSCRDSSMSGEKSKEKATEIRIKETKEVKKKTKKVKTEKERKGNQQIREFVDATT